MEQSDPRNWQRAFFIPLTILAWLAVIVIGGWLLGHILKTILTLILSGIVAFALTPLVKVLSRFMPRGIAIAVAYVLGFTVILGFGALLVVTAAEQTTNLVHDIPAYAKRLQHFQPQIVRALGPFGVTNAKFHTAEQQAIAALQSLGTTAASQSLSIITSVLGTIVDIILVLILSVYLTANGQRIAQRLQNETPSAQRRHTELLIAIVNQVVGGYIRGTLTLAALVGFLVGAGMLVLHVQYAVLLGILAFFMEFIPVLGVLVSGAVCVLVALFQGWILALIVLGYFVFVHVIEGDVVGPRIMGRAVGIHPATALVALVAGTELFGIWGALFASPVAGLLQAIGTAAWREMHGADPQVVLHAVKEAAVAEIEDEDEDELGDQTDSGSRPLPRDKAPPAAGQ